MNDLFLADANVLLAVLQPKHLRHAEAVAGLRELIRRADQLVLAPQTLYEIYAVATRPATSNGGLGLSPADAKDLLDKLQATYVLLDERPLFATWQRLVSSYDTIGKASHDARLVAFAIEHGLTQILTFNTGDFARYAPEGVIPIHPAALPPFVLASYAGNALEDVLAAIARLNESTKRQTGIFLAQMADTRASAVGLHEIVISSVPPSGQMELIRENIIVGAASVGSAADQLEHETEVAKAHVTVAHNAAPFVSDVLDMSRADHRAMAKQLVISLTELMSAREDHLEGLQYARQTHSEIPDIPDIPEFAASRDRLIAALSKLWEVYNQDWFAMQDMVDGLILSLGEDAAPSTP